MACRGCRTWSLQLWHTGSKALGLHSCGFTFFVACQILVPQPGIKPVSPALQCGFLTTGPLGKSPPFYFLFLWVRLLQVPHVSGVILIQYLFSYVWLFSLSITSWSFNPVVARVRTSFLVLVAYYSSMWPFSLSIHLSMDSWVVPIFCLLWIVQLQTIVCTYPFALLLSIPENFLLK